MYVTKMAHYSMAHYTFVLAVQAIATQLSESTPFSLRSTKSLSLYIKEHRSLLPNSIEEDRTAYKVTVKIKNNASKKEKTAFVSKTNETGSTLKISSQRGILQ